MNRKASVASYQNKSGALKDATNRSRGAIAEDNLQACPTYSHTSSRYSSTARPGTTIAIPTRAEEGYVPCLLHLQTFLVQNHVCPSVHRHIYLVVEESAHFCCRTFNLERVEHRNFPVLQDRSVLVLCLHLHTQTIRRFLDGASSPACYLALSRCFLLPPYPFHPCGPT